jgi:PleD family two-component response regulator
MQSWLIWLLAWVLLAVPLSFFVGRFLRLSASSLAGADAETAARADARTRSAPIAAQSAFNPPREPLESRRILIVDDDAPLRALLHTTLTAEFEVAEAADAERASHLARLWRPTLVLLDVAAGALGRIVLNDQVP